MFKKKCKYVLGLINTYKLFFVLDKTLKGICDVQSNNQKVLCTPNPRTKYFESIFLYHSINCNFFLFVKFPKKRKKNVNAHN